MNLFWDMVSPKIKDYPALDAKTVRVTREYSTDVNRRIDIVEDAHYGYELYRQFARKPDAAAHQIVSIVQALENAGKE
ncbi:hypothetical protein FACS189491_04910 [Spirochaetia bacterium]|nr:hypothetical protein FACS189491_04910 [Spirochaetia bacterium]